MQIAGWVLVHFVWQGTALALAAGLSLYVCRRQSAGVRYVIACSMLVVMLATAAATAAIVHANRTGEGTPQRVRVTLMRQSAAEVGVALPIQLDVRPPAAGVRARTEALFPWLVSVWLIGVVVLVARATIGWWRVSRVHRLGLSSPPSRWQAAANRIADRLGLTRFVRIVELPHIDVPFVVGCLRPIVVLPLSAMTQLNVMQVEAILAHELAHVRRHDYLVNLLQTLVETLFFYHPAVWWLSARIRDEREHCCDDVAVEMCGDPVGYAAALTELESWRRGELSLAAAATGGSLLHRVRRILRVDIPDDSRATSWTVALVVAAVIGGAALTAFAQTQTPVEPNPKFEVASVRPNKSGNVGGSVKPEPGGRFNVVNMPLRNLIISAYGLQGTQLLGAPDWIASERFDIAAKADGELGRPFSPDGPSRLQLLIRSLLAERFKLSVHREKREMPIYELVLARRDRKLGPELKPSTIDCRAIIEARKAQGQKPEPPKAGERPQCGARVGFGELAAGGQPLFELITLLSSTVQRNVVDRTGLSGNFDIYLRWTPDQLPRRPAGTPADQPFRMNGLEIDPNGPSIFAALQEQLGLKLESARGPVEVLVIDHVERPTPD
jgi:uncharacterized protein (TIGR03435 family)